MEFQSSTCVNSYRLQKTMFWLQPKMLIRSDGRLTSNIPYYMKFISQLYSPTVNLCDFPIYNIYVRKSHFLLIYYNRRRCDSSSIFYIKYWIAIERTKTAFNKNKWTRKMKWWWAGIGKLWHSDGRRWVIDLMRPIS